LSIHLIEKNKKLKNMRKTNKQLSPVIAELAHSIIKLYETMGFQTKGFHLKQPSRQEVIVEKLAHNDAAFQNIESLKGAIERLAKKFEDRELDQWSESQTFERQKAELEQQLKQLEELNNQKQQLAQLLTTQEEKINQLNMQLDASEKQSAGVLEKQFLTFVREIISVRDNLAMKEEMLKEEDNYQETKAWKFIQLSYLETEGILKRMGVMLLNQTGTFDAQTQMVTDTVPTDDELLHDMIAQTFREGYRTEGKIIRPQEVVLYSYKK